MSKEKITGSYKLSKIIGGFEKNKHTLSSVEGQTIIMKMLIPLGNIRIKELIEKIYSRHCS